MSRIGPLNRGYGKKRTLSQNQKKKTITYLPALQGDNLL